MSTMTTVLAGLLALAFAVLGLAKLASVPAMRSRAEHVGFSAGAYRKIGALEILAVAGVCAGWAVPVIGAAAAAGLLLLLGGAILTHLRNGDGPRELAPAVVLALVALTYLVLVLGRL